MVRRGFSDAYGSWKTSCMSRRSRFMRGGVAARTSSPPKRTVPASGSINLRIRRASVDFPQPDSPTMPSVSVG